MNRTAMIEVLGAIAYGERKAYDGARAQAEVAATPAERKVWRTIAAEELRHHKGFVRRLQALGADPERAMAPYRASLDRFHSAPLEDDPVAEAVIALLGEGIAADMLTWLRRVVDPETAAFVDTVIADEEGHEQRAVEEVRRLIATAPDGRRRAARAGRRMLVRMATAGTASSQGVRLAAFLRLGRPADLVAALTVGFARRLDLIGAGPVSTVERLDFTGSLRRLDPLGLHRRAGEAA